MYDETVPAAEPLRAVAAAQEPADPRDPWLRPGAAGARVRSRPGQPGHGCAAAPRSQPAMIADGQIAGGHAGASALICCECGGNPYLGLPGSVLACRGSASRTRQPGDVPHTGSAAAIWPGQRQRVPQEPRRGGSVTAETPVHDTLAGLFAAAAGHGGVPPGQAADGQRVRSLEVRWIFPGRLTAAVAGWFARFPARTESREDAYLLDRGWPGVSVKVRGGGRCEVKVYRGSPGILEVAGPRPRALGGLAEVAPCAAPVQPRQRYPAGWRPVRKRRRISRFSLADGQIVARAQQRGREPGCEVELTEIRTERPGLVVPGIRGDRPRRPAPQPTPGHRRARVRPGPARRRGTWPGSLQVLSAVAWPAAGHRE